MQVQNVYQNVYYKCLVYRNVFININIKIDNMTYNFKHIRLFENSPFKKISKSEKPADDLSAVRKVSANIIKENLSEKLYYILHLFYYHLLLINRDEKIKSITSLTGEK